MRSTRHFGFAGLVVLVIMALLGACRMVETRVQRVDYIPAPDGIHAAYVYLYEPPGGALADTYYEIAIAPVKLWQEPWHDGEVVWRSKEIWPQYVLWTSDRSLEVLLAPGKRINRTVSAPSSKYSVSTRVLKSTLKSEVMGAE